MSVTLKNLEKRIQQLVKENKRLKVENKHLTTIMDLIPANVYWKNTKGIFLGCNQQMRKKMQEDLNLISQEEYLGKSDIDVIGVEKGNEINRGDQLVIQSKKTLLFEEIVKFPSGKKVTYLSSKAPLLDEKGKATGIVGVSYDITNQKKLEKELKKAKEKLEATEQARKELFSQMTQEITGQLLDKTTSHPLIKSSPRRG